jgi:hypothetical protein
MSTFAAPTRKAARAFVTALDESAITNKLCSRKVDNDFI